MEHDLHGEPRFFRGLVVGLLICMPVWVALGVAVAEAVR